MPETKKSWSADMLIDALFEYDSACERKDWDEKFDGPTLTQIRLHNEACREIHRLVAIRDDTDIPHG